MTTSPDLFARILKCQNELSPDLAELVLSVVSDALKPADLLPMRDDLIRQAADLLPNGRGKAQRLFERSRRLTGRCPIDPVGILLYRATKLFELPRSYEQFSRILNRK